MCKDCDIEEEQLIRKLDAGDKALDAIERVRDLHRPDKPYLGATDARSVTADKLITPCYSCEQEYPCSTIRALDGETDE